MWILDLKGDSQVLNIDEAMKTYPEIKSAVRVPARVKFRLRDAHIGAILYGQRFLNEEEPR